MPYKGHDGNLRDGFWESGARLAELQTHKIHPEGSLLASYMEKVPDSMSCTQLLKEKWGRNCKNTGKFVDQEKMRKSARFGRYTAPLPSRKDIV